MTQQNTVDHFVQIICDPNIKLDSCLWLLQRPKNHQQLKICSKNLFFAVVSLLREECDKIILDRIAYLVMLAIMSGHFHILNIINRYLLPDLIDICSGVLKFTPLHPTKSMNIQIEPSKWRTQFASQLLLLLSEWFPHDFINKQQQSKYTKIVKSKKILVKGYYILTYPFIKQIETYLDQNEQTDNFCIYCSQCYQKQIQKLKAKQKKDNEKGDIIMKVPNIDHIRNRIYQKIKVKQSKTVCANLTQREPVLYNDDEIRKVNSPSITARLKQKIKINNRMNSRDRKHHLSSENTLQHVSHPANQNILRR